MSGIIEFSLVEKTLLTEMIQDYFQENLSQELGRFDAEFMVEFMSEKLGVFFYNRGLYDAQAILSKNMDVLTESIYQLEKPTAFKR